MSQNTPDFHRGSGVSPGVDLVSVWNFPNRSGGHVPEARRACSDSSHKMPSSKCCSSLTRRAVMAGFHLPLTLATLLVAGQGVETASGQEKTSRRPDIRWDNGKVDFHAPGAPHDHSHEIPGVSIEDTPEDKKLKASMTPEQRGEYDRQRRIAESHEILARAIRFAQVAADDTSPLAKDYMTAFEGFRESLKKTILVMNRMSVAFDISPEEVDALQSSWSDSLRDSHAARQAWIEKGTEIYLSDPMKYENIGPALKEMLLYDFSANRFDPWKVPVTEFLKLDDSDLSEELIFKLMLTSLAINEYDTAIKWGERLHSLNPELGQQNEFVKSIPELKQEWERELEFRKRDAEKNDNPRVEFVTSKGRLEIELFEDDAPQAVANFIYLIERGYYNRKGFFRVEHLSVVQTGCEKGDGSGDAGYTIASDANPMNYRPHLRGSLGVALGGGSGDQPDLNSGSSQFYIPVMPLDHLNKTYTVFGRIVEGIENIGLLRQMNLADSKEKEEGKQPDFIISAKVLKKRDHEYKPTPVRGRLF